MANQFLGEIRMFGGNFAPLGWYLCNGQLLAIAENSALFSLIGTTYGGDGQVTFQLPNLQGRFPIHQGNFQGNGFVIGQLAGAEAVTLTQDQLPQHTHAMGGANAGNQTTPVSGFLGSDPGANTAAYSDEAPSGTTMAPTMVSSVGGSQPHPNLQPFLVINFIIAAEGIYPSQN